MWEEKLKWKPSRGREGCLWYEMELGPSLAEHKCSHIILEGIPMGMGVPRVSHWISTARSLPAHSLGGSSIMGHPGHLWLNKGFVHRLPGGQWDGLVWKLPRRTALSWITSGRTCRSSETSVHHEEPPSASNGKCSRTEKCDQITPTTQYWNR